MMLSQYEQERREFINGDKNEILRKKIKDIQNILHTTSTTEKLSIWSFTMDYETKEIVMNIALDNGEKVQIRDCEKDIDSMKSWFDLTR